MAPFFFIFPYYIKKEDAKAFLQRKRQIAAIVIFSTGAVVAIMRLIVVPKLLSLYQDTNTQLPLPTQLLPYIMVILMIGLFLLAAYFFAVPVNSTQLDKKLSKYKNDEMIRTHEIVDWKLIMLAFSLFAVAVCYIIISIVLPIYTLTANFS